MTSIPSSTFVSPELLANLVVRGPSEEELATNGAISELIARERLDSTLASTQLGYSEQRKNLLLQLFERVTAAREPIVDREFARLFPYADLETVFEQQDLSIRDLGTNRSINDRPLTDELYRQSLNQTPTAPRTPQADPYRPRSHQTSDVRRQPYEAPKKQGEESARRQPYEKQSSHRRQRSQGDSLVQKFLRVLGFGSRD